MANRARLNINIKKAADRIAAILEKANLPPKEQDESVGALPAAPVSAPDDGAGEMSSGPVSPAHADSNEGGH